MIEPFYFAGAAGQLFGVYHGPQGIRSPRMGIVLCYPAGQEYIPRIGRSCAWRGSWRMTDLPCCGLTIMGAAIPRRMQPGHAKTVG